MTDSESAARSFKVDYAQFTGGPLLKAARASAGVFTWPILWPLAMVCRSSDLLFRTVSEALSLVPYVFGVVMRGAFYRFALRKCGTNIVIEFGTIFLYRDTTIGDNVLIGRYSIVHHCDFGDYVLVGERCTFLNGATYHYHDRTDIPMALQGGELQRIRIERDCWIGSNATVLADVGEGAIVGAASLVLHPVEPFAIVAGNPARVLSHRGESPGRRETA